MMMPSIFGENLFDDFMNDFSFPTFPNVDKELYGKHAKNLMKTDVKDAGDHYELEMEMPGVEKENIKAELKDSYLTVTAQQNTNKDEKDKQGNYIRRERYSGSCQRSFYVGESVKQEDLKAAFNNGILTVAVPKEVQKPVEEKQYITIE